MIDATLAKVKGFLTKPVDTFQQTKDDEPKGVFTYYVVLLLIFSLLSAIVTAIGLDSMFANPLPIAGGFFVVFIASFIEMFISTLIFAAWLHLWVYIFGGRNGIMQTMKALLYGSTPHLLLGWIPFIGILFSLWALMCSILGIRELQELSTGKAAAVFVIAIIVPSIALSLLMILFLSIMTMNMTEVFLVPQ